MLGTLIAARALPNTNRFIIILLACFLAVAPDVIEIPYYFLGIKNISWITKLIEFQRAHQWNIRQGYGVLVQIGVVLAALAVIYH